MTRSPRFTRGKLASAVLLLASLNTPQPGWSQMPGLPTAPSAPPMARQPALAPARTSEPNLLLLEVRLDGSLLNEAFTAYELGDDVLLPLGELARLLTLGITVDPATRTAAGFVLQEERSFRLEMDSARVLLPGSAGSSQAVDPALLRWIDDDLYVASRLLQRWWPVDLELSLSSLRLKVLPRETLPIQARLARERAAKGLRGRSGYGEHDPGYPRAERDYSVLSVPFIDQTLGLQTSRDASGKTTTSAAYSAFITGDLLGMEAALFVTSTKDKPQPEARLTLSRHDPDAELLGPLRARSVTLGHVGVPALANVMRGAGGGKGLVLSNRPLNQPSSYGLHKLHGDLPTGWDVTLYFNDALIGFQQGRSDGLYEFEEQPLVFGRNEFRLVFNGPLGQARVERQVFLLDQTLTKPGKLYYTAGVQRGDNGSTRQTVQMDVGLVDSLAATMGLVGVKPATKNTGTSQPGPERQYANLGLRASMAGALLSADLAHAQGGSHLVELGVRTSLAGFSLDATHAQLKGFVSDFFGASSDPLRTRERARISGSVGLPGTGLRLPLGLDVLHEVTESGRASNNAQARLSLNVAGTSFTHSLNGQSSAGSRSSGGMLQVSRRVAGVGLSSQLAYTIKPVSQVASLAITVDKSLNLDSRLNLGLVRTLRPGQTVVTAGYTRNFGSFGVGVSGRHGNKGDMGLGVQIFMALGRDPRTGRWVQDWQPLAGSGVVSARAFIDDNMNGRFDEGEPPVEGVGFIMNGGGRHPVRTNSDGLAYLSRLAPKLYADVGIDVATLEDPHWQPLVPGVRVLPRPGKVHQVDFPVVMTGEIDGTVYLMRDGKQGGIGNAEVELVDVQGAVVTRVRSGTDGYYVMPAIRPGRYRLRISPVQLDKLGLNPVDAVAIQMRGDGDFINGKDFLLSKKP